MSMKRTSQNEATPGRGTPWPAGVAPHGYDQSEFPPEQCTRDFNRPRRPHTVDEERRLLRIIDADIGNQAGSAHPPIREKWDADDDLRVDGASRLYKD